MCHPCPAAPEDPCNEPVDSGAKHSMLFVYLMAPRLIGCHSTGRVLENKQRCAAICAVTTSCTALLAAVGMPCEDHSPGMHAGPFSTRVAHTRPTRRHGSSGTKRHSMPHKMCAPLRGFPSTTSKHNGLLCPVPWHGTYILLYCHATPISRCSCSAHNINTLPNYKVVSRYTCYLSEHCSPNACGHIATPNCALSQ